jgi:hypothetical protein
LSSVSRVSARKLEGMNVMFGVLPDGVSEVDALREEIVGLQWSYANAKGESGNSFYGV